MTDWSLPLSAGDLKRIGMALDPIETNQYLTENPVIGRIEVMRPDGDENDIIGYFERVGTTGSGDCWFGFVPREHD